jgi:hypothetical protein
VSHYVGKKHQPFARDFNNVLNMTVKKIKILKQTYELILKQRPKVATENILETETC